VLVFALDGANALPGVEAVAPRTPEPPPLSDDPEQVARGKALYHESCFACHGADVISSSSQMPDLRYMGAKKHELFLPITLDGVLHSRGMASYSEWVSEDQAKAIHAYVIQEAHKLLAEVEASTD
jgi:quinohemoprotein ethanol dehydrogenase